MSLPCLYLTFQFILCTMKWHFIEKTSHFFTWRVSDFIRKDIKKKRKRLFTDTVSVNKIHLTDTVSVNKMHLTDTVPVNKFHFPGTVSVIKMHLTGTLHGKLFTKTWKTCWKPSSIQTWSNLKASPNSMYTHPHLCNFITLQDLDWKWSPWEDLGLATYYLPLASCY